MPQDPPDQAALPQQASILEPQSEQELVYQEIILGHARQPQGYGKWATDCTKHTEINELCGDEVTMGLGWDERGGARLGFACACCLLCKASASILVEAGLGRTAAELAALIDRFRTTFAQIDSPVPAGLPGVTEALYDLRRYPTRERCVLLPWDAVYKLLYP